MITDDYVASIHLALIDSPIVEHYDVVRQRVTSQSGYLRVRIDLTDGDLLEAAEFLRLTPSGLQVEDYRHQWMAAGTLSASDGTARHTTPIWGTRHTTVTMVAKSR